MSQTILPTTQRKHQDAIALYEKLSSETEILQGKKVRKYHRDYCLAKAAHEHYMLPRTLENILYGR